MRLRLSLLVLYVVVGFLSACSHDREALNSRDNSSNSKDPDRSSLEPSSRTDSPTSLGRDDHVPVPKLLGVVVDEKLIPVGTSRRTVNGTSLRKYEFTSVGMAPDTYVNTYWATEELTPRGDRPVGAEGLSLTIHSDGRLLAATQFEDGQQHGYAEQYDLATGKLVYQAEFMHGKQIGVAFWFYTSGKVRRERHEPDNDGVAQQITYFADGTKESEGGYLGTRKHGPWKTYFPNGKLQDDGAYDNGREVGVWKYYNEDGTLALEDDLGR